MKISAGDQLRGTVESIQPNGIVAEVVVRLIRIAGLRQSTAVAELPR